MIDYTGHPMSAEIDKGQARQAALENGAPLNETELRLLEVARYCRDAGGALPFPEIETAGLRLRDHDGHARAESTREVEALRRRVAELEALIHDTPHTYAISEMLVLLDAQPRESANAAAKRLRARVEELENVIFDAVEACDLKEFADARGYLHVYIAKLRASLAALEGHEKPCHYCGELCSSVAGNPARWPIPLCHSDEPGVVKWHHVGCVSARLARLAALEAPPVVPEGWEVCNDLNIPGRWGWFGTNAETQLARAVPAVLRALAWAIEHDARPPHAADVKGGG